MNLKRSSTMFLKVIIFLAGISVLALLFLVPEMADFTANLYPNITPIKYLVFIVMYGAAVPFTLLFIRLSIFYSTLMRTQRSRNYQ